MSYDVNQYYGLGLKVKDIAAFVPKGKEVAVYFPYEVTNMNGGDVTKDMLIKYGYFEQYEKLSRMPDDTEDPETRVKFMIDNTTEGEDVFVDLKQALKDLLKAQKIGGEVEHGETESLIYATLDVYLSLDLDILDSGGFIISSTRWGDLHNPGGMVRGESYFIFEDWENDPRWDGTRWKDPRDDPKTKKILNKIKKALVGDKHPGFELLTPIFGG